MTARLGRCFGRCFWRAARRVRRRRGSGWAPVVQGLEVAWLGVGCRSAPGLLRGQESRERKAGGERR